MFRHGGGGAAGGVTSKFCVAWSPIVGDAFRFLYGDVHIPPTTMDPGGLVGCSGPALGISLLAQGFSSVIFLCTWHICFERLNLKCICPIFWNYFSVGLGLPLASACRPQVFPVELYLNIFKECGNQNNILLLVIWSNTLSDWLAITVHKRRHNFLGGVLPHVITRHFLARCT